MPAILKHAKFIVALAGVAVTALDQAYASGPSASTIAIATVSAIFVWLVPNAKNA
jgi:hypothetical protein